MSIRSSPCSEAQGCAQLVLRQALHADQQAAAVALAAGPALDEVVELLPAAQVEVADAEVGAVGRPRASAASAGSKCCSMLSKMRGMNSVRVISQESSDCDSLDFVERNLVACAVIKFHRIRRLVGRNLLSPFDGLPPSRGPQTRRPE